MLSVVEKLHLRRTAKLIEFSNEAALNADDSYFLYDQPSSSSNREIIYVFDEAAFRFFFNPDERRRKYSSYFHLMEWRDPKDDPAKMEPYWILLNEMTACLTSEFMLSLQLKGQREQCIYMSLWHYDQLLDACARTLLNVYEGSAPEHLESTVSRRQLVRAHINAALENGPDHWAEHDDLLLPQDEREFREAVDRSDSPTGQEEAAALRQARRLARTFAQGRKALIPDQLRHVSGLLDGDTIGILEDRFGLTKSDMRQITTDAGEWKDDLLTKDFERSAKAIIPLHQPEGLGDDALTLALVQHIARHKINPEKQRIVFVTGDRLVIDTYREWYSRAYLKEPTEPNVVRAIGYFAPIMNMSDLRLADTNVKKLFDLLQVALNITLMPFNLVSYANTQAGSEQHKQRFANLSFLRSQLLRACDDQPTQLDGYLTDALWYSMRKGGNDFLKLVSKYQALERNTLRIGLELLQRRATRHLQAASISDDGEQSDAYYSEVVMNLVGGSARLYAPLIESIIRDGAARLPRHPRVAVALRIDAPLATGETASRNIVAWVEKLLKFEGRSRFRPAREKGSGRRPTSLVKSSLAPLGRRDAYLVPVIGTIVALRRGWWEQAGRLARDAKVAFRHLWEESSDPTESETYQELRYLAAMTARYIIASTPRPSEGAGGEDIWRKQLASAEIDLDACIAYYHTRGSSLCEARSVSERAACHLFYASWALAGPDLTPGGYSGEQALQSLEYAVRDLMTAYAAIAKPEFDEFHDTVLAGNVKWQVFANIASAYLVEQKMPGTGRRHRFPPAFIENMKDPFSRWVSNVNFKALPDVVKGECQLFAARLGLIPLDDDRTMPTGATARLALDDLLIEVFELPSGTK